MTRACATAWLAAVMMATAALSGAASAGPKLAIFPIDMSFPRSEDDFFSANRGPSPDEQRRLSLARAELGKLLSANGRYEIVDLAPLETEIAAAQPIYNCNGCEIDIAAKAKAELVLTSNIDKISETHLSLTVAIVDVAQSKLVSNSSVLIQGNTDEAWLHGVRWLARNRLLAEGKSQ